LRPLTNAIFPFSPGKTAKAAAGAESETAMDIAPMAHFACLLTLASLLNKRT
jgi:hypothetical protein